MGKPAIRELDTKKRRSFYLDEESLVLIKVLAVSRGTGIEETVSDIVRSFINRNDTVLESLKKTIESAQDRIQW